MAAAKARCSDKYRAYTKRYTKSRRDKTSRPEAARLRWKFSTNNWQYWETACRTGD